MRIKFKTNGKVIELSSEGHSKTKLVKVRKIHKCGDCTRDIEVGEMAYHHSYSDGYKYHNDYICPDCYEIVDDKTEMSHCTCSEENDKGHVKTSISSCLVHGTIITYIYGRLENKHFKCSGCGCCMSGVREDNFYEGKWYGDLHCDNPYCKDPESRHICKWWLGDNQKMKQELIDKEIQRRMDNNLPMGKVEESE